MALTGCRVRVAAAAPRRQRQRRRSQLDRRELEKRPRPADTEEKAGIRFPVQSGRFTTMAGLAALPRRRRPVAPEMATLLPPRRQRAVPVAMAAASAALEGTPAPQAPPQPVVMATLHPLRLLREGDWAAVGTFRAAEETPLPRLTHRRLEVGPQRRESSLRHGRAARRVLLHAERRCEIQRHDV